MNVPERFELLFGPNRTPVFRNGAVVTCAERGRVTLVVVHRERPRRFELLYGLSRSRRGARGR